MMLSESSQTNGSGFRVHENAAPLKRAKRPRPRPCESRFRVHENAAPLKRIRRADYERPYMRRFRVHENAAPLKLAQYGRACCRDDVSAFMRTRPH